jgi:preprotein translocase subunit YajC
MNNLFMLMGGGAPGAGGAIGQIVPLVLIVVVFYFFMIRPQMKKAKDQKKYIEALKVGDKILTIGGVYGTIFKMNDDGTIVITIEDGGKLKISKNAISQDATSTLNQA